MYVSKLIIQSFRGIPGELQLDFNQGSGDIPKSLLIVGDNGTGKSSIVDAIEFALQARINRTSKIDDIYKPSATSFKSQGSSKVKVILSDGTLVERGIIREGNRLRMTNKKPHPKFSISPLVLRRADIQRFIDTPETERLTIFFDYLQSPGYNKWDDLPNEKIRALEEQIKEKKSNKRKELDHLAQMLGLLPNEVPVDKNNFKLFAKKMGSNQEEVQVAITKINRLNKDIDLINSDIGRENKINLPPKKTIIREFFSNVEDKLTHVFHEISDDCDVKKIDLKCNVITDVSLSVRIHLLGGKVCSPQQYLSEANLDLIVLLTFLSIAKESAIRGQAKLLIFDDILSSVDSTIRRRIADYIVREFNDWQLIFTVHERIWQAQLREIFRINKRQLVECEIIRWESNRGPIILQPHGDNIDLLKDTIERGEINNIINQAGIVLENICNQLSWILPISIPRKKRDRYTLGDFWPGIYKKLEKTNVHETVMTINDLVPNRNYFAHYNEWADISLRDAEDFGEAVIKLWWQVKCIECHNWVKETEKDKEWKCDCGSTNISRTSDGLKKKKKEKI